MELVRRILHPSAPTPADDTQPAQLHTRRDTTCIASDMWNVKIKTNGCYRWNLNMNSDKLELGDGKDAMEHGHEHARWTDWRTAMDRLEIGHWID